MKSYQSPSTGYVDFKQVKSSVTMLQVLERYQLTETFKQTGDRLSGPCPIHKGSNPTAFRVSISKNCFNCFGSCGRGGNVIDFVALMEDIEFREAAVLLQEWFSAKTSGSRRSRKATVPKGHARKEAAKADEDTAPEPASPASDADDSCNPPLSFELKTLKTDHPYFDERGLDPETIDYFGLGYCSRGILRGHIVIPIHNRDGELVAYAGRWPGDPPEGSPKYRLPKGFRKSHEIFNLHRALEEDEDLPIVIVEGFFDCFVLWQAGITKCVALMGSTMSPEQEQILFDSLPAGSSIEILLDNDEAGIHGAKFILERLSQHSAPRIITLPAHIRQPDQLSQDEMAEIFA